MAQTVLGIVKFEWQSGQPCAFRKACESARVSFQCQSVDSTDEGTRYFRGAGEYANRSRFPIPALLVLDLDLEKSLDLLAWLRAQPASRYLPVVVLSTSKGQTIMRRAYDKGASSFLIKPADLPSLLELVKIIDRYWLTLNQAPRP
jgi:CheY-like chemotaxis protein